MIPNWARQLKCYDGTDPDTYRQKIEEKRKIHTEEVLTNDNDNAAKILRMVVVHSTSLSLAEHTENKEILCKVNWLCVENDAHQKSPEFHDVLSRSFDYYFKKKDIKQLKKYYRHPHHGVDAIKLFFGQLSAIISEVEARNGILVSEMSSPVWTAVIQRIEYITRCDAFLKHCARRVQSRTVEYLSRVLVDRASGRFKRPIEAMAGRLNHQLFKKEINRVLDMNLNTTKSNSLFSYFDRQNVGVLNGEDVTQALVHMTIDLQKLKSPKRKSQQQGQEPLAGHHEGLPNRPNDGDCDDFNGNCSISVCCSGGSGGDLSSGVASMKGPPSNPFLPKSHKDKIPAPSEKIFNQTIIKLSDAVSWSLQQGSFVPLSIPDGFVNEDFVRASLTAQLGIKLSKLEIHLLCERLRKGNENVAPSLSSELRAKAKGGIGGGHISSTSSEASFLPSIDYNKSTVHGDSSRADTHQEGAIILGKYVKVFITSMKQICSKRMRGRVEACKPLFMK